jgi:hypothetical protein
MRIDEPTKAANRMKGRSVNGAVKAGTRLQHQYDDMMIL